MKTTRITRTLLSYPFSKYRDGELKNFLFGVQPLSMLCMSVVLLVVLAACGAGAPAPTVTPRSDFKVGLVLNEGGTIRDGGFNQSAFKGVSNAGNTFGLDVAYRETISGKDYVPAIDALVAEGRNIIITVGFQMIDATIEGATKHPNVKFIGVDFTLDPLPPNFVGVLFREDEGGFLAGAMAGMMTKTNVVAVLGGQQIPPVERFVQGFLNGAMYVNRDVKTLSKFSSSFNNAEEGRASVQEFMDQKADVIFGAGGFTGSSGIAFAASQKVYVIGVDQDEFNTTFGLGRDAEYILTSAVKRVDNAVFSTINDALNNKFISETKTLGAEQCGIAYAPYHKAESVVPEAVDKRLAAIWRALAGGTLQTGAGTNNAAVPASLNAGELPVIAQTAPTYLSCTYGGY